MQFKKQQGAAAIEFAIIFPIFFLIFYAIITYGLIFAVQQTVTLAAAEGARAAVRYQAGKDQDAKTAARIGAACDMSGGFKPEVQHLPRSKVRRCHHLVRPRPISNFSLKSASPLPA